MRKGPVDRRRERGALLLTSLLARYVIGRDIERQSLKPLRSAIHVYSVHLGRPAMLADLSSDTLNTWLAEELETERVCRRTARNYRASILTLWRFAFDENLTPAPPLRVRLIRAPLAPVAAYTKEEVQRLIEACDTLDDKFCRLRVPRRILYRALIATTWDTGFRPGDLMRLRWANISDDGCVQIIQHKTKGSITRWLDPSTLSVLRQIRLKGEPTVFRCHTSLETWRFVFRSLKLAAKVSAARRNGFVARWQPKSQSHTATKQPATLWATKRQD